MPLAYTDDVDKFGRSICEVAAAFSKFAEKARCIGLAVNESKRKLLLSTAKDTSIRVSVEICGYNFEVITDFIYLGSSINTDNDISLEILCRITVANRYFGLGKQLSKRALSCRTKMCLYKCLILPVLLYSAETWTLTSSDEQALGVFERKILCKIYEPFCDREEWRIQCNQKLYEIYEAY